MEEGRYFTSIVRKSGKQVFSSDVDVDSALNTELKEHKLGVPPYRGRLYQEIFGNGRPSYSSK